jgi:hypothetical protein
MTGSGCRAAPVVSNSRGTALVVTCTLPRTVVSTSSASEVRCWGKARNTETASAACRKRKQHRCDKALSTTPACVFASLEST